MTDRWYFWALILALLLFPQLKQGAIRDRAQYFDGFKWLLMIIIIDAVRSFVLPFFSLLDSGNAKAIAIGEHVAMGLQMICLALALLRLMVAINKPENGSCEKMKEQSSSS